ncbi:MAG: glycine--tRNA ligase subunit beta [Nitrosomonas sp.]|nr:glycine--tRNA ligase subunit beta [Nitrosomonas sp.]
MTAKNLLVELLVEELPPKSLKQLGNSFAELLTASLKAQDLVTQNTEVTSYASPRRLAVHLTHVVAQAANKSVTQKLMPVNVGLDNNGHATPPLLKKLAGLGADASVVPTLKKKIDGKAEVLFLDSIVPGIELANGLQTALDEAIGKLPIPKVMTYQLADGWQSVNFVRPAHGLVALHGTEIVAVNSLGLIAGRETQGHRFEASVNPVQLKDADSYAQQLATEGAVIASFAARRAEINDQITTAAKKENLTLIEDDNLLDEVTALVEHPNVLVGTFESEFLDVPHECLILTMKANQKYFPLFDAQEKLANKFLLVSNIRPIDTSHVVHGNERVIRSRLADAKFFYDQDRKKTLASRVSDLDKVVYHNKLGTQGERIQRVCAIAQLIGLQLGGEILAKEAYAAANLAKADLLTEMVGEFPELQGTMGHYYALHDGHSETIAHAIEDHYKPRFAGDTLPRNRVGICVALADKLETLAGLFSIKQIPTGDKDPFALRRHALGVIRMLIEKELPLKLNELIQQVIEIIKDKEISEQWVKRMSDEIKRSEKSGGVGHGSRQVADEVSEQLFAFIFERLAGNLRDQGYSPQEVDAVLSLRPQNLSEIPKRLAAVRAFTDLPEAISLAAANKRVGNILKKVNTDISNKVSVNLLQEPAEHALLQALDSVYSQADKTFSAGDYTESLQILAALKSPIDTFFDNVMVNAEDTSLRNNRLALLAQLHQTMNRVADISKLAT